VKYPHTLTPTAYKEIYLLTGGIVSVPKATPRFSSWRGASPQDTYGGKQVIDLNGEPVFAELAILRLLQAEGWQGRWIDTYRNRKWITINSFVELPSNRNELLQQIYQSVGSKAGCFDVYCWRGTQVLFAESKRKGRDRIRDTQRRWLAAALDIGLPIESFLIVEWSLIEV
jgi:hypothetical protein